MLLFYVPPQRPLVSSCNPEALLNMQVLFVLIPYMFLEKAVIVCSGALLECSESSPSKL